mmetsp:Transcript_101971/g.266150  ORF Transcript_101971/g.266150 Transcript_101971/m.266150 type:complete len:227 (-) Transcript_101971:65-745(-)
MRVQPLSFARLRRKSSMTSRRTMPMNSSSFKVWPICTSLFVGEIMVIFLTFLSTMSMGKSNSSSMQRGMAPPHGLQLSSLRSMRYVSMPALASVSAQLAPAGPPPTTATRNLRPSGSVAPAQTTMQAPRSDGFAWTPTKDAAAGALAAAIFAFRRRPPATAAPATAAAATAPQAPPEEGAGAATAAAPRSAAAGGATRSEASKATGETATGSPPAANARAMISGSA